MARIYSRPVFVNEALKRLSLIHSTDFKTVSGKNKLTFELNGEKFEIQKSVDKTLGKRKTIVEGCDNNMIPVILYQSEDDCFTDRDLEELVCALDHYFIVERIEESGAMAICNRYYYISQLLQWLGYDLETFYGEASMANGDAIILMFLAKNKNDKDQSVVFFVFDNYEVQIPIFKYSTKNILLNIEDNNKTSDIVIEYAGNSPENILTTVKQYLDKYYNLVPYEGTFYYS